MTEKGPFMSRRRFLGLMGVGSAAMLLRSSGSNAVNLSVDKLPIVDEHQYEEKEVVESTKPKSLEEVFEEQNMSEFLEFYKTVINATNRFCAFSDSYYFNRIFDVCWDISAGEVDETSISQIRDGWGERSNLIKHDAINHVNNINIDNHDTTGDPEKFRNKLKLFADRFAPIALSLPDQIYLTQYSAQTMETMIATISDQNNWGESEVWAKFFHEATHALDIWSDRVQSYVTKESFLKYATTYFEISDKLLTNWFKIDTEEEAQNYWSNNIVSWVGDLPDNPDFANTLTNLELQYFNTDHSEESIGNRVNRLAWDLGRRIITIREKEVDGIPLSNEELQLLNNNEVSVLMSAVFQNTMHFLVNAPEDMFYESPFEPNTVSWARQAMNDVRIRTFASFNLDSSLDISTQVRNQLMSNSG